MSLSWFSVHAIFGSVFGWLFTMNLHKYKSLMKRFKKQGINSAELGLFTNRNNHQRRSVKKAAVKNFAIFTGKHHWWSLFSMKWQAWKPATLLKRDSNTCEYLWILQYFWRTPTLRNSCKRLLLYLISCFRLVTIFKFHCSYRVNDQYQTSFDYIQYTLW